MDILCAKIELDTMPHLEQEKPHIPTNPSMTCGIDTLKIKIYGVCVCVCARLFLILGNQKATRLSCVGWFGIYGVYVNLSIGDDMTR